MGVLIVDSNRLSLEVKPKDKHNFLIINDPYDPSEDKHTKYSWEYDDNDDDPVEEEKIEDSLSSNKTDLESIKISEDNENHDSCLRSQDIDEKDYKIIISRPTPPLHFCKKCNIVQGRRTRHCNACEACVAKFDHHCFWIGSCVGELNHRLYWTLVGSLSLEQIIALLYLIPGVIGATGTREYLYFLLGVILASLVLLFVGILFSYHTFLILSNSTTWEQTKWKTIDYMRVFPKGYKPFSHGAVQNVLNICCHSGNLREWELPNIDEVWSCPKI